MHSAALVHRAALLVELLFLQLCYVSLLLRLPSPYLLLLLILLLLLLLFLLQMLLLLLTLTSLSFPASSYCKQSVSD